MQNYRIIDLRKWILLLILIPFSFSFASVHPFYLSITDCKYNQQSKKMEVSVKLFIDDFEKTLHNIHKIPVDIIHPKDLNAAEKQVEDYISNHLQINYNGKLLALQFIGYEKEEEAVWSYFESEAIEWPKTISITNTLLYQYIPDQINIMHVNVGTQKKSYKLDNPQSKAEFNF